MNIEHNTLYGKIFVAACLVVGFLLIWTVQEEKTADVLKGQIINERLSHIEEKVFTTEELSFELDDLVNYNQGG